MPEFPFPHFCVCVTNTHHQQGTGPSSDQSCRTNLQTATKSKLVWGLHSDNKDKIKTNQMGTPMCVASTRSDHSPLNRPIEGKWNHQILLICSDLFTPAASTSLEVALAERFELIPLRVLHGSPHLCCAIILRIITLSAT